MFRKGKQDKKRAKVFSKLIREITVAVRSGMPDPDQNPRLRGAISAARAANMPKHTIERAIKRGSGDEDGVNYEEIRYEGYGPNGVAVIVEAMTDNRNRTASTVRSTFSKNGGNLGETGSVSFMFDRKGEITYPASVGDADTVMMAAIEAGAQDFVPDDEGATLFITDPTDLDAVCKALPEQGFTVNSAKLGYRPKNPVTSLTPEQMEEVEAFLEAIDAHDDVQNVYVGLAG